MSNTSLMSSYLAFNYSNFSIKFFDSFSFVSLAFLFLESASFFVNLALKFLID